MTTKLAGMRIVNTRAIHQAEELDTALRSAGAVPIAYPCIAIAPPDDLTNLDETLLRLIKGDFEWLVLTSVNTVHSLGLRGFRIVRTQHFRVAAIGLATKALAESQLGLSVELVPVTHSSLGLSESLQINPGDRFLLPASDIARSDLPGRISEHGGEVTVVSAYRTVTGSGGADLPAMIQRGEIDAFTFASPSAAYGLHERLNNQCVPSKRFVHIPSACIGSVTAKSAQLCGFTRVSESSEATVGSLVDVLYSFVSELRQGETL